MTNKLGHMEIVPQELRNLDQEDYAKRMAEALLKGPRPPKPIAPTHFNGKPVTKLTDEERQEFYLSMQPVSTQAVLRRDPKDDAEAWNRPILNWKAVEGCDTTTPEGIAKAVAKRALDPAEVVIVEGIRRKARNTLGDSKDSAFSKETKERAAQAFTYSRPANPTAIELK